MWQQIYEFCEPTPWVPVNLIDVGVRIAMVTKLTQRMHKRRRYPWDLVGRSLFCAIRWFEQRCLTPLQEKEETGVIKLCKAKMEEMRRSRAGWRNTDERKSSPISSSANIGICISKKETKKKRYKISNTLEGSCTF